MNDRKRITYEDSRICLTGSFLRLVGRRFPAVSYELTAIREDPTLSHGAFIWRLDRVSQRTIFWYETAIEPTKPKKAKKTFRNPIIQAREMQIEMECCNLTKAQLSRKLGISRARVTQILNLLKLPDELIREVDEMGDNWEKRLVTERMLRHMRRTRQP